MASSGEEGRRHRRAARAARAEVVGEGLGETEDGSGMVNVVVAALRGECSERGVTKSAKRTMLMTASWQSP